MRWHPSWLILLCLGLLLPEAGCKSKRRTVAEETEATSPGTVTTSTTHATTLARQQQTKEKNPDAGLSGLARVWTEQEIKSRLHNLGLAYHNYFNTFNKAPAKAADLAPFYEKDRNITEALDKGWVVFGYGVGPLQMREGTSNTILAYEADPDGQGMRWVLMADGSVKKVSRPEFEQMPKAGKS